MAGTSRNSAYPLAWPAGWPRTKTPRASSFKTSLAGALEHVRSSVNLFAKDSGKQVTEVLISSNVTLGEQRPADSGVAIYFTWDQISTCIAVDRYEKLEDNLQAIHHVIEAERTKLRHGGLNLVRAAFRGYAALPPPSEASRRPWYTTLGVAPTATPEEVEGAYKRLRSAAHPDRGGTAEAFHEIQLAFEQAGQR